MTAYIASPLGLLVAYCALTDLRFQKIPNLVTLPAALLAMAYHTYHGGLAGLYTSLAGWVLGLALLIIPYGMKAMGAGDIKLLAAIGAIIGPLAVFKVFLYMAVIGGAYALIYRCQTQTVQSCFGDIYQTLKHLFLFRRLPPAGNKTVKNGKPLCYGLAIAAGTYVYIGEASGLYRIIGA
jgi:prepilin peptidase CpaA